MGGCRQADYSWVQQQEGKSILDLEYLNDTLGIRVQDIRLVNLGEDQYKIDVYLFPDDPAQFNEKQRFYLHLFPGEHENDEFLAVGTLDFRVEKDAHIYSRTFTTARHEFDSLRYGLINADGRRVFSLKVDTLAINTN
ncbi:hypothetical protein SAMN04490243_1135 [Robiginitalea myxolifaciens]|uniref:Uncharacterized protein n=2 Tax=Robiginitalea myxolifaciens TaxID=400055 RepID=A0A1I6G2J4_9FLAO|nr:hypothetical protein SAMN04490243_1135 [Robiginitalea myxolifaciens]